MLHHYAHGTRPRYSHATGTSDTMDGLVTCGSPAYQDHDDGTWTVVGVCEFSGNVPIWADSSGSPVWECPRCGREHREDQPE